MRASWVAAGVVCALGTIADGATLSVNPGGIGGYYAVGQPITITVTGNAQGAAALGAYGRLVLGNPAIAAPNVDPASPVQSPLGGFWVMGGTGCDASSCVMINAISFDPELEGSVPPNPFSSTVSFVATTPGTSSLTWATGAPQPPSEWLDFFGLTNAPGSSITVLPSAAPTLTIDPGGDDGAYTVGDLVTITVTGRLEPRQRRIRVRRARLQQSCDRSTEHRRRRACAERLGVDGRVDHLFHELHVESLRPAQRDRTEL